MFIVNKHTLVSMSLLFIYIFILSQIMRYLYIPKTNCEKNNYKALSLIQWRQAGAQSKGVLGENEMGLMENSTQPHQAKVALDVLGMDARAQGDNQSISTQNTLSASLFPILRKIDVLGKSGIYLTASSVITWVDCKLEVFKSFPSLASARIRSLLPEPQATFATQFVFGKQFQTSKDLYQLFKVTGMLHLLVISGFHLQITASLCYAIVTKLLNKIQASIVVVLCVWLYASMLSQSIPIERAVLATSVALTAKIFNREYNPKLTLLIIAVLMIAREPAVLSSLSFQLSFMASAIILWIYPIVSGTTSKIEEFRRGSLASILAESLLLSLVVTLSFSPLLSYYFGYFSLVTLLASPLFGLFLPFIFPLIWILSLAIFSEAWLGLGLLLSGLLKGMLSGLFYLMELGSQLPILTINYRLQSVTVIVSWYLFLLVLVGVHHYRKQQSILAQTKIKSVYA